MKQFIGHKLPKSQLVQTLRDMADAVESGDSLEGMIDYRFTDPTTEILYPDAPEVRAIWDIGNNDGNPSTNRIGELQDSSEKTR